MKSKLIILLFLILHVTLYTLHGNCQSGIFNHPELKWKIVETEHFKVMADDSFMDVAKDIAQIAEEIYQRVTEDLGYTPNFKVPLVVIDYDEEFNGSAEPLFGRMVIYCSSGTKVTSGNLTWFRRVVAHEFSHVISFGAIGAFEGMNQRYQVIGALQVIPMWFLEGIAQWEGETWDTHRDMFMRMTVLGGKLLPPEKLDGFAGSDIRESRLVYEQGHSLIRFIAATYGRDKIRKILHELRKGPFVLAGAVKKVLRVDLSKVYAGWYENIRGEYTRVKDRTKPYYEYALRLTEVGGWMYHPVFSPDGRQVLYASSFDYDYAFCDLLIAELKDNRLVKPKKIAQRTGFFHSFSPDGRKILFTKIDYRKNGSYTEDIFVMDSTGQDKKQLTFNERAKHPSFSPDGKKIAYVVNRKGVTDIWTMDADGSNRVNLTEGDDYEQNDSPQWSGDGRYIAFSRFTQSNRDIALIDFNTQRIIRLTDDEWDDRTPVFLPVPKGSIWNSSGVLYTSDRGTGIPNLFLMKIRHDENDEIMIEEPVQLTNVTGGIFEPAVDPSGNRVVFSGFGPKGFDLYLCGLDRLGKYETPDIDYLTLQRERNKMYVSPSKILPDAMLLHAEQSETSAAETLADIQASDTQLRESQAHETLADSQSRDTQEIPEAERADPYYPEEELQAPVVAQVSEPRKYNSFAEIKPIFILPAIVLSTDGKQLQGWGTVDFYFLDPLEKHTIMGYAYFDGVDATYSMTYINRQLYPVIYLSSYQGQYYWVGTNTWARSRGNLAQADFPIDGNRTITLAGLSEGREDVTTDDTGYITGSNFKLDNTLGILYRYYTVKERVDANFNPAGGRNVTFSYFWSDPVLGGNYRYNLYGLDWREYVDVWRRAGHTLAARLYLRVMENSEGHSIAIPWDVNLLRGISAGSVSGTRNLAFSLEYRFPVVRDLRFNFMGMYFDRWYVVPFLDCGSAWTGTDFPAAVSRYSLGLEYRFQFWVMSRYAMILRAGICTTDIFSDPVKGGFFISVQPVF